MIKILALDMDGTLLNSKKEIPKAHIEALHQAIEKGALFGLTAKQALIPTTRRYTSARAITGVSTVAGPGAEAE